MSLFKSIGGAIKRVVSSPAVAAAATVFNPAIGGALTAAQRLMPQRVVGPGLSGSLLPAMGALPAIAGGVARIGIAGARSAMRGAIQLCRRHPQWCSTIGGTAAVAAMIESGQLPAPRHRRGRGLSARDLRGFRKTARLMRQVAGTIGLRRGGGRGKASSSTMITQN
jgi:hypothetical protein